MDKEKQRLKEDKDKTKSWKKWGPYLTERQWGTVREDYSEDANPWTYLTHEMARSKAYRWGEEGIAGISDNQQLLCFSLALWNGQDPFLKERLFGLTNNEGNHGEDVKENYYYLDNTPTHSYMKMLYKYPQNEFPYQMLRDKNSERDRKESEFELIDTGIFDKDKYFDIFIEYAKASEEDILISFNIFNRASEKAEIYVLPQLWFRNTWAWGYDDYKPEMSKLNSHTIKINYKNDQIGERWLYCDQNKQLLFCDNETNTELLYKDKSDNQYYKDGINDYIIDKNKKSVNPEQKGTKAAALYHYQIDGGESITIKMRLSNQVLKDPFSEFDSIFELRKQEADEFYNSLKPKLSDQDEINIQRQAFAGMLWNKQLYYFDIPQWLNGDPAQPVPPESRKKGLNSEWQHLNNFEIISMPDKWEYPWYAAWDLAFHCIPFAEIDPDFAKDQLILLLREWYMHPNGQLPAYEWKLDDVNPPVHAWATWKVYEIDKNNTGIADTEFLQRVYHKLIFNFTWWVNKKDKEGRNIFQGGFLGLDNVGLFDRSQDLPNDGHIEQSDGTSWMAMFSLNMMRISLELAKTNCTYQDLATKFFEHFLYIAEAMTDMAKSDISLWDEEDEFFYDVLQIPGQKAFPVKIRSVVGLIPLFAVEVLDPELLDANPEFAQRLKWFLNYRPDLAALVSRWEFTGKGESQLLSLLRGHRMKRLLKRMLDSTEFLSDYGVRSLSKYHKENPYSLENTSEDLFLKYEPGDSDTGAFGGNSNWRGPVWFPTNYLIIESLLKFHSYYGDEFKVECPTNSGNFLTIKEIAIELSKRLKKLFLKDKSGHRPVFGNNSKLQNDPHFKDYILFYEFFHGDNGKGLGASHQTGWTGLIIKLLNTDNF